MIVFDARARYLTGLLGWPTYDPRRRYLSGYDPRQRYLFGYNAQQQRRSRLGDDSTDYVNSELAKLQQPQPVSSSPDWYTSYQQYEAGPDKPATVVVGTPPTSQNQVTNFLNKQSIKGVPNGALLLGLGVLGMFAGGGGKRR